jgi:NitT/TauT family transport system ATP-binding protein
VTLLRIEDVGRRFGNGVQALRGASLEVGQGDFVALLGPSGCGKSTLLRMIAGLDAPDAGALRWEGGAPGAGEIGFVFQDATLLPWATAAENVWLPLRLRGVGRAAADGRVMAALARVGLSGFEGARPRELSGGMRMRVSIARALVGRPRVLLMDEPFAALDEFTRHGLQEDLLALWRAEGCTVMFVTHSIYEAAFLAQRIAVMAPRPGRVVRVLDRPAAAAGRFSPEYAAFVGEASGVLRAVMT